MDANSNQPKVKKRTSNACERCRRQKIKCTGTLPCGHCSKQRKNCVFDNKEPSVSVSKRFLSELEKRLAVLEGSSDSPAAPHRSSAASPTNFTGVYLTSDTFSRTEENDRPAGNEAFHRSSVDETGLTNPLSAGPSDSAFILDTSAPGRYPLYLGTSSNWSFSRRVLDITSKAGRRVPLGPENFAMDGDIYDLGWDGSRAAAHEEKPTLPTLSQAVYLARSVQFHIGEVYHLFDETSFMRELHHYYEGPTDGSQTHDTLWYIHFLLIMAFGKAFVQRTVVAHGRPPGAEYFVQAMKQLPDAAHCWKSPFTATEIYCCAALYLQCADFRYGAYLMIGHAMRTALFQGMQTAMPVEVFGNAKVQRARNIWWTVYILDRELSSLMGCPIQLPDENITAELPSVYVSSSPTALRLHIKLCRIVAQVVSTVYGPDGRLDRRFLTSTKSALTSIADIAEELSNGFKLPLNETGAGLSRMAAFLHLLYHHCIILATRPLMFSLFKKKVESESGSSNTKASIQRLRVLIQMCADSSQQSLRILSALQDQGLLESFIPFDLEHAYCSSVITLMASVLDPALVENYSSTLHAALRVHDGLISGGSLVARSRKAELEQLEHMLQGLRYREGPARSTNRFIPEGNIGSIGMVDAYVPEAARESLSQIGEDPSQGFGQPFDDWTWEDALNSTQLLNVADFLDENSLDGFSSSFDY